MGAPFLSVPPPPYTEYLVCCDEAGTNGARFYGFGSLWLPWQRRGDIYEKVFDPLRARHGFTHEAKWNRIARKTEGFYLDLVQKFFETNWLLFHCVVVKVALIDKKLHQGAGKSGGGLDLARRKHFGMLLANKVKRFADGRGDKSFVVWADPIASRYTKADEAALVITNRTLKTKGSPAQVTDLRIHNSKETPGIQLADVLLGAVVAGWNQEVTAEPKRKVMEEVARHLGWPDLRSDTHVSEWKFNVWYWCNPQHPREVSTRAVTYLLPPRLYGSAGLAEA